MARVLSCELPFHTTLARTKLLQWRLLLAGLDPVEFRDFYLGDMFCSLTYAMGVSHAFSTSNRATNHALLLEHRAVLLSLCP